MIKLEKIISEYDLRCMSVLTTYQGKEPERFYMNNLHVEKAGLKKYIVATNGRALGYLETEIPDDRLPDADYQLVKLSRTNLWIDPIEPKELGGTYPAWQRIIPEDSKLNLLKEKIYLQNKAEISHLLFLLNRKAVCINYQYLEGLKGLELKVYYQEENSRKAIVLRADKLSLIIMPMEPQLEVISERIASYDM